MNNSIHSKQCKDLQFRHAILSCLWWASALCLRVFRKILRNNFIITVAHTRKEGGRNVLGVLIQRPQQMWKPRGIPRQPERHLQNESPNRYYGEHEKSGGRCSCELQIAIVPLCLLQPCDQTLATEIRHFPPRRFRQDF